MSEQSFVSLGLCVTLCTVAWRTSKIESIAQEASASAATLAMEQDKMRDIREERWAVIISELAALKAQISGLRDMIKRNSR